MNWKPIGDQVLLKQLEKQDKTQSGIIIMNSLDDYIECDVMQPVMDYLHKQVQKFQ
jgi:co-chaperonin GroES (HSP10)